jgi:uncharacterized protein (TIGR02271 family)
MEDDMKRKDDLERRDDLERTAVGYFRDRASADRAYEDLVGHGFDRDDISILGRGREGGKGLADDDHVSAGEGAAVGGIAGLLIGAAAMLIPGIGPIVAIGPITAALTGAITGGVTGAVVGGIAGALIDAGVPEEDARYYDERFRQGGYLVTVHADGRERDARDVMARLGADMRPTTGGATTGTTATGTATAGHADRVELREEQLRARKETTEAGQVSVSKDVVTEQRSMNVPVTHEEVYVERKPVQRRPADSADLGDREEIRVPVREEEVHVEKQPVVTEEVTVGKQPVQETEHVTGTVRKEVPRVERTGDVDVRGDDTPRRAP